MKKETRSKIAAVILCGGTGRRMRSRTTHKVCFPILGEPAINRAIRTYKTCGISDFVVVIGAMAGDVVETIGRAHQDICYAYQEVQLGTGHAARRGFVLLERLGFAGPVMVTMGDKVIEPAVIEQLIETFVKQSADAAFAVIPKTPKSTAGRVLMDRSGGALGSFELLDLQLAKALGAVAAACRGKSAVSASKLRALVQREVDEHERAIAAMGPLWKLIQKGGRVSCSSIRKNLPPHPGMMSVSGRLIPAAQIEHDSKYVNPSVYMFSMEALGAALDGIRPEHPGGLEYLTDAINILAGDAQGYKVVPVVFDDPNMVLGFNTPEELLEVQDYVRRRRRRGRAAREVRVGPRMRLDTAEQWLRRFTRPTRSFQRVLRRIYGTDETFVNERRAAVAGVLKHFIRKFGADKPVVVARSPGRINLMGRHVDHRGGHVNMMAIDKEILLVGSPREDDVLRLTNVDSANFPDRQFAIRDQLADLEWDDWLSYVDSRRVQQMVLDSKGDWSNYAKAAVLRLQQRFMSVRLRGMDCAVAGNVPMAAGLSSSSAVVVAVAEAAIALNGLDVKPSEFVDLCGEGEWFVGSRGGAADHAAIKFGKAGTIVHLRFFPFEVERAVPFPEGYRLVICNSHAQAKKSAGARDQFNQRIASYEFGFWIIKDRFPEYAHLLEHLRDLSTRKLGITLSRIFEILLRVPERITRKELVRILSAQYREKMDAVFASHAEPDFYSPRSVVLFGLAEMERSRMCADLLAEGEIELLGTLMNVSHDGDRVAVHDEKLRARPYDWSVPDGYLRRLIEDLSSEDPERVLRAQLYMQPGGYACSTPEIDLMVDIAGRVEGVVGAQLSGAGLGGCIMVLVEEDAVPRLKRALAEKFYRPRRLKPDMSACRPMSGAMIFPRA